ncbi:hypothetical protein D9M68_925550 [compost metagenome]
MPLIQVLAGRIVTYGASVSSNRVVTPLTLRRSCNVRSIGRVGASGVLSACGEVSRPLSKVLAFGAWSTRCGFNRRG